MDRDSVLKLKKFVEVVTGKTSKLVRFDVCDEKVCRRAGLPTSVSYIAPPTLTEDLEVFDPTRHDVVKDIVCVSKAHKRLLGIACNLLEMGVVIVRNKKR